MRRIFLFLFIFLGVARVPATLAQSEPEDQTAIVFDWDGVLSLLDAPVVLFEVGGTKELIITSEEFAHRRDEIGKSFHPGYEIRKDAQNPQNSSFRYTDSLDKNYFLESLLASKKPLAETLGPQFARFRAALRNPRLHSWIFILTSRGHSPEQFLEGLKHYQKLGLLEDLPDLQRIFTVAYKHGKTAQLPNVDAKVFYLKQFLDELSAKSAKTKHYFEFVDDSPAYVNGAIKGLQEEIKAGRWANVNVVIRYAGKATDKVSMPISLLTPQGAQPAPDFLLKSVESKEIDPWRSCPDGLSRYPSSKNKNQKCVVGY